MLATFTDHAWARPTTPDDAVQRALAGVVRRERHPIPTSDGPFRASGLGRLCPRGAVIAAEGARRAHAVLLPDGPPMVVREDDAKDVWATAVGTAYHRAWQEELLPLLPGVTLMGWWERDVPIVKGGPEYRAVERVVGVKMPTPALAHGWIPCPPGAGWRYVELAFQDCVHGLTGHCDGILRWADGALEVVELKTVSPRSFAMIDPAVGGAPFREHTLQVRMYMHWAGLARGRLIYIRKEADAAVGALAEHLVRPDPEAVAEVHATVADVRAALAAQEAWWAAGCAGPKPPWPARCVPGCRYKGDRKAKWCPQRAACFARDIAKACAGDGSMQKPSP
jgi:hypothetical protein